MAESFLCAPFTEALGVDPVGTAGEFHDVIVVDLALPWPREILDHEALGGVAEAVAAAEAAGRFVRVLGSVPTGSVHRLRHWTRPAGRPVFQFSGRERTVDTGATATEVLRCIEQRPLGERIEHRYLLVCGHGARDRCCGNLGTRLHGFLSTGTAAARVLRISHTGGHRFAPTAISMPEGRAWAFLDETVGDEIAARSGPASTLRRHDRGSLTMPSAAQVVDAALFSQRGWEWLDVPRHGRMLSDETAEVTWTDPDGVDWVATGTVRKLRDVPSVTCGVEIDEHKTFPEWGLAALSITTRSAH